jgi:hypothetical protein
MPSWYLKAAVQGALSRLPNPQRYNRWFQKRVTKSLELTEPYFASKFEQCRRHLEIYQKHVGMTEARPLVALELGTGWFPIIPIGLGLGGAGTVYSVDQQSLLTHETVRATLAMYAKVLQYGAVPGWSAEARQRVERVLAMDQRASAGDLLAHLGIVTLVTDARQLGLQTASVDLVCSNNTLEHIPGPVILDLFKEFQRVLSERGIMNHHIDMADHYANFDKRITVYNFLKFPEPVWRLFNNDLQYQNRLRLPDFRQLHLQAGFEVIEERNQSRVDELRAVRLAAQFHNYDLQELAVYDTWLTSRPRARP